jgi:hypothetical protein
VIIANLIYRIPDFRRGKYFVIAQFPVDQSMTTTRNGISIASSDGDFPTEDYPVLLEPEGQLQLKFPMKYVWNHPEVVRPFRVKFHLNMKTGTRSSTVVATVGPFEYQPQ